MSDVFSVHKRSSIMRAVRSKGTGPEKQLRRVLLDLRLRTRTHAEDLPGTPDLVVRDLPLAIFVHGCFWHGHTRCPRGALPTTHRAFWARKILGNRKRDRIAARRLRDRGFRVLTIWACQLKEGHKVVRRVLAAVESARGTADRGGAQL